MAGKAYPCLICKQPASDSHHIYPVQYGGAATGPTVDLCKNHHTGNGGVHWWADAIWAKRATLEQVPAGDLRTLAKAILDQRAVFQRTGEAPDARRRIVAELSEEEQGFMRLIKNHYGFGSIEATLKALIVREAERIRSGKA